jgi:hypothetical protein
VIKKFAKKYEEVYKALRVIAKDAITGLHKEPHGGIVVAGAQAEALARTLKDYTLKGLRKRLHAEYLHRLFSTLLSEVLKGRPHLSGKIVVVERRNRKKV